MAARLTGASIADSIVLLTFSDRAQGWHLLVADSVGFLHIVCSYLQPASRCICAGAQLFKSSKERCRYGARYLTFNETKTLPLQCCIFRTIICTHGRLQVMIGVLNGIKPGTSRSSFRAVDIGAYPDSVTPLVSFFFPFFFLSLVFLRWLPDVNWCLVAGRARSVRAYYRVGRRVCVRVS